MSQPQTMSQKILSSRAGLPSVEPGAIVEAAVDMVLANDVSAPMMIRGFKEAGGERVFDPARVVLVADHFTPNKDVASALIVNEMSEFASSQRLEHRFEGGRSGVAHVLLAEQGLTLPGELIIGGDSRALTYGALGAFATGVGATDLAAALVTGRTWFKVPETIRVQLSGELGPWVGGMDIALALLNTLGPEGAHYQSLEFHGPLVEALSMEARQTISNLMVESGAKAALFPVDQATTDYLAGKAKRSWHSVAPDPEAAYSRTIELDVSGLEPLAARPHLPHDVAPAHSAGYEPVNQVFIGSCAAARLEDLRVAAKVLEGRTVHPRVRLMVIPATPALALAALREGLTETFVAAGGMVGPPSCGPCAGGHLGVLAPGEVAVATANRNYRGRMGHPGSRIYLAGPAVAAASAILGRLASPTEVVS
ncbi:MAG: 3-isopropylmalate dehydratase large subunit [Desulfarculaceae bacterium]|nr:3-isopropylmalate dehydratase large subunit [Desulfarculaceae bacterium]MCF8070999.1 3-isopropylmalate dehydratase large subunit [Desulfarculaceae bacterium]MCF8100587.1 3-isopropylmalate dehydratase large subunit [Desulfarculaceae bacterium]MCF8117719.1 3-isopropylmalate dehydratase large subunit [Desulfarculaceae bacterium]